LFAGIYGIALPRTAREQYNNSQRISRTELKEGDLIFFNTTGGVSHVGMYLQNNKFVHASSSGVTISDIFDEYWVRRFVGVGRVQDTQEAPVLISKL
jgi:cell wall-associated NlpC family hydrolase